MNCNCSGQPCQCKQTVDNKTPLSFINTSTVDCTNILIGPGNNDYGRNGFTLGGYVFDPYHPRTVINVQVKSETIEITYIRRAIYSYTTYNNISIGTSQEVHNPDIVFKEIYGVKDNKLTLLNTVFGKIIPPKLEETYEFPE